MGLSILHANENVLMQCGFESLMIGGGIERIDRALSESELNEKILLNSYQLVVMDPFSGPSFSLDTALTFRQKYPEMKVLVISEVDNINQTMMILEKGINGFLTRECDEEEIKHAIFSVARGEKFYCNKVLELFLENPKSEGEDNCDPTILSARENEIATLVASGMTNKTIAKKLHLSHHTVHTHRKNILKKLGINSASELTIYALRVGLIDEQ